MDGIHNSIILLIIYVLQFVEMELSKDFSNVMTRIYYKMTDVIQNVKYNFLFFNKNKLQCIVYCYLF
jgi:hypothetical protein